MASLTPYTFHNTDRIGTDSTDQTQRNVSNTQFANYMLTDHFSKKISDDHVKFVKGSPKEFIAGLDPKTNQNIWLVGGADLLTSFLCEQQVHEFIIFTMPVLLGEGIALFENLELTPRIILQNCQTYQKGVIQSHYILK